MLLLIRCGLFWDSLIIYCCMFCCALLCVHYSFAIILMGESKLVALGFFLSSWCLVIVVWLFRTVPRVCLQFVIVVFPDHTHLILTVGQNMKCSTAVQASNITMTDNVSAKRVKVSKGTKIRNRYNQVPHLTQDTNGKVTNSQLDT